jgi:uncharacterized repeat protein (TIGR03803 family)
LLPPDNDRPFSEGCQNVVNGNDGARAAVRGFILPGVADGNQPWAGLIAAGGALYGTTEQGGANATGEVYRVTP